MRKGATGLQHYAVCFVPEELRETTKTGTMDDTVLLDGRDVPCLGRALTTRQAGA